MRVDVDDRFALLGGVVIPWRPLQRLAGHLLAEVMHALFGHGRIIGRSLFLLAVHVGEAREFALQQGGDLVALCHDVVENHAFFAGRIERLLEQLEIFRRDGHRFVGQHVVAGLDTFQNVFGLARVVAGENHNVAGLVLQHFFEEVRPCVDHALPRGRLFGARVETVDPVHVHFQIGTFRRVNVDGG